MATILFVDDEKGLGGYTCEKLSEFHTVDFICRPTWQEASTAISRLRRKRWDICILDIRYSTDIWGGVWLYGDLNRKGIRNRWKHTLVFSQYVTPRLKDATRGEALMLRGFLVAAGIPFDCALSNKDFDRATLIERIGRF